VIWYSALGLIEDLDMRKPLDRKRLGDILNEIDRIEISDGGPILSAVVVYRKSSKPGPGFFALARSLDLLTGDDEETFYPKELRKVYDHWASR